jgi:hypothetical protein
MDSTVYVIDYASMLSEINSAKTYLSNISSYKEGGLSSYFSALEDALSFDPNSYSYAINSDGKTVSGVTDCSNRINTIMNSLSTSKTADSYSVLRTAISNAKATYDSSDLSSAYTTASLSTFNSAYESAKSEMANLITYGYKTDSTPTALASALDSALSSLERVADFTKLDEAYSEADSILSSLSDMSMRFMQRLMFLLL